MPLVVRAGASMDSDAMIADLLRRMRRLEKRPSSGFDPNEDPVIIGGASTTAGSTPDNPLPADTGLVVIGNGAYYSGSGGPAVSLGFDATTADNCVAVGSNATANAGYDVAIGDSAIADGGQCTAVGSGANATHQYSTALGYDTETNAAGGVAIGADSSGAGAVSVGTNHYVHGTANHRHFIPGLPTSDPGVSGQLWNSGGVVSVSP